MPERSPVPALDRGLRILAELACHPDGLAFGEIAARFALANTVCSRLLKVLTGHGFVCRDVGSGRYFLDQHAPIRGIRQQLEDIEAATVLPDLSADTGCTALIVARDGAGMRHVAKHRAPGGPAMRAVGSLRYTFFTHPWGWCVLARLPGAELQRVIRRERPDDPALAAFHKARRDLERQGWCWERTGEGQRLAAAVTDPRGQVVAALALGGTPERSARQRAGGLLRLAADDLARRLAGSVTYR